LSAVTDPLPAAAVITGSGPRRLERETAADDEDRGG
jgi:hypothetical protein